MSWLRLAFTEIFGVRNHLEHSKIWSWFLSFLPLFLRRVLVLKDNFYYHCKDPTFLRSWNTERKRSALPFHLKLKFLKGPQFLSKSWEWHKHWLRSRDSKERPIGLSVDCLPSHFGPSAPGRNCKNNWNIAITLLIFKIRKNASLHF